MAVPHSRSGGRILVDQLVAQGVERLTCVPGESYLAVLDALHDAAIDVLVCRNEGGAGMMAEAHGKLTGRPGICFVTRGPGATNASPAVHIARQDSTPMIVFVGQVERGMRGREAFQELDYRAVFGALAKWAVEIDDAGAAARDRRPRLPRRHAGPARAGGGRAARGRAERRRRASPTRRASSRSRPRRPPPTWRGLPTLLGAAERPLAIVGGSRWSAEAVASFARFAERFELPVAASFRRAELFPADHPNLRRRPRPRRRIRSSPRG